MPMGSRCSPVLSYTVISISFALSMVNSCSSSIHLSFLVGLVRPLIASSTLMLMKVSGPRLKRLVVAWSTSATAWMRRERWPLNGFLWLGMFRLSSRVLVNTM
jgi:hypothetical protein